MPIDGSFAQGEFVGDRLVRLAGCDQAKDLTLPRRQQLPLRRRSGLRRVEPGEIRRRCQLAKNGSRGAEFEGGAVRIAK